MPRRRRRILAVPCVKPNMMMIAAGGNKYRIGTVMLHYFKAQQVAVKAERPLNIGYFKMHMADACAGGNSIIHKKPFKDVNCIKFPAIRTVFYIFFLDRNLDFLDHPASLASRGSH